MAGGAGMSKRGHNTALIGERTRSQILDAAERLFAEHGPEAVSIRAIADSAGVAIFISIFNRPNRFFDGAKFFTAAE
jgi:AcrR family transcriptional regulator